MAASTEHGRTREALVGVAIALLHLGVLALFGPSLGVSFPLDDAYTHQVYAEGLRYGDGLAYLPGVPAAGSTSPLWALALVPIQLAPVAASVPLTQALGVLLWLGLAWTAGALGRRFDPTVGPFAAFAVLLDPSLAMAALSGMEVLLAAWLVMGAWLALHDERPRLAGLLFGLGIAARPELTVAWVVATAFVAVRDRRPPWALLVPGVVVWGAWAAWNHHAVGTWLPTTFFAKHGPQSIAARWLDLPRAVAQTAGALPMLALLPLAALAFRRTWSVARPLWIFLLLWPLALAWAHDLRETWRLYWWRYALPAHPLLLVFVVVGAAGLSRRRLAFGAVAAVCLLGVVQVGPHLAGSCRNVAELNVAAARWLDAHAGPNDWVASNDAGAVRRLTGRPVVDLLGLNDAEVLVDRVAVLERRRPGWYVVFPSWFPNLVSSPRYEVVRRFESTPLEICGECEQSELVVLRPRL
ncbi:MAG: DUF2029 domain-containing protein [Sandaracinus sp.]|nr:DUF2029 domain-containing protein [Sandaracinus sp.]